MAQSANVVQPQDFPYKNLPANGTRLLYIDSYTESTGISCRLVDVPDYFTPSKSEIVGINFRRIVKSTDEHAVVRDGSDDWGHVALSYCWGDTSNRRSITLNGLPFEVTSNLFEALRAIALYEDSTRPYWIDAICINQANIPEKNEQVHQMWRIYASAHKVLAWLGSEEKSTQVAFAQMDQPGEMSSELRQLCENPYFERTWIAPEVFQAHEITLRCGRFVKPWESGDGTFSSDTKRETPAARLGWARSMMEHHGINILDHFHWTKCQDRRDRVFAILAHPLVAAIIPTGRARPDYNLTIEQVLLIALGWFDHQYQPFDAMSNKSLWINNAFVTLHSLLRLLQIEIPDGNFGLWVVQQTDHWELGPGKSGHGALVLKPSGQEISIQVGSLTLFMVFTLWLPEEVYTLVDSEWEVSKQMYLLLYGPSGRIRQHREATEFTNWTVP